MNILAQPFPGAFLIALDSARDDRGEFVRLFDHKAFSKIGADHGVDHTAESINPMTGTLRGLHFQKPPYEEQKLVRCVRGQIFDVAVDLRLGSPTEGRVFHTILESAGRQCLLLPRGIAHGFLTLCDDTIVSYHIFTPYHAPSASGICFDDPDLAIPWPREPSLVSPRDKAWPRFRDVPRAERPVFS
jgi:dTDP-4-dehydrorhamnose 3,5-epimerase